MANEATIERLRKEKRECAAGCRQQGIDDGKRNTESLSYPDLLLVEKLYRTIETNETIILSLSNFREADMHKKLCDSISNYSDDNRMFNENEYLRGYVESAAKFYRSVKDQL